MIFPPPQVVFGLLLVSTGGLIGGGLAAAISKKDAYGWSMPLGAALGMGMGIANADC